MARSKIRNAAKRGAASTRRSPGSFGPVSQINTAPVSVGNSVRGSRPAVTQTTDGARVVGRDFAFALSASAAAITNWELIGGMPITPAALPSSVLRNYCQMFNKFKVNRLVVHYITSSPTSQAGDVLFYYEKDATAPMCDYSSSNFLPFVLSDPHTVIGPQWTNHSMSVKPTPEWKTTLYGTNPDINEDKAGTIFLFSKTNAANSPGYILIDYDISFRTLSVNPRAGQLPVARAQSTFVCLTATMATTAGVALPWTITSGKNIANITSALPQGATPGDVYKAVLQITASTQVNPAWSATPTPTVSNILQYNATNRAVTLDDGFTVYLVYQTSTQFYMFVTPEEAVTMSGALEAQTSWASGTINICAEIQLLRNINELNQSSY
nr:MAG: hypothetical protein 3 [Luteoviridae sp.]